MKRAYGQATPQQCFRKGAERVYQIAVAWQAIRVREVTRRATEAKRSK